MRVIKRLLYLMTICMIMTGYALAVPASPESDLYGTEGGLCGSESFDLVDMDTLPKYGVQTDNAEFISGPLGAPAQGSYLPLLIVVVGFNGGKDEGGVKVAYDNDLDWSGYIFSGADSLRQYYSDMSFGQFTFEPATETCSYKKGVVTNVRDKVNDGVVHVNVDHDHLYYDTDNIQSERGKQLAAVLSDAIYAASDYVDFASYDTNNNKKIDNNELALGFVIAGYEASSSQLSSSEKQGDKGKKYLWAHAWDIYSMIYYSGSELSTPVTDGVKVNKYIAISEYRKEVSEGDPVVRNPYCVIAHELGHYIGLKDYYNLRGKTTDDWSGYKVGVNSLMANGVWGKNANGETIPYGLDVYSRYLLGWVNPTEAAVSGAYEVKWQDYSKPSAGMDALIIKTDREKEFYIIENRHFDKWDTMLAKNNFPANSDKSSLIIWHIDEEIFETYGTVNDYNHRPGIMPVFPEKDEEGAYTLRGTEVEQNPYFTKTSFEKYFGVGESENLVLYSHGPNDTPSGRFNCCVALSVQSDAGEKMKVKVDYDAHANGLAYISAMLPAYGYDGVRAHWYCAVCDKYYLDPEGKQEVAYNDLIMPAGNIYTESVTINAHELSSVTGASFTLTAKVSPENVTNGDIEWRSSNESVATVKDGKVTCKKFGTVTLYATTTDGTDLVDSCSLEVLFNDVTDSSKYWYTPVYYAAQNGITNGYSGVYFGPEEECTRTQVMIFLWRLAGQPSVAGMKNSFNDVDTSLGNSAYKAIIWGAGNGIVKGYEDGGFHPNDTITRKDVLIMLYRMAGKPETGTEGSPTGFLDVDGVYKITSDTYRAIEWGVACGITKGYSEGELAGCFGTGLNCLRKDIITFFYRFCKNV